MSIRNRPPCQPQPVAIGWLSALLLLVAYATGWPQERETVLDSIVTLTDTVFDVVPETPRWCDRLSLASRRVDVGSAMLHIEEDGEGVPLVLLHGGPGATHHYFHPWFSRATQFAHVIYVDQRGCGLSQYASGPDGYSVDQAVDDLDALRARLGFDKWVVLGHSYGGLLAQYYATRYPERVAGMVLVSASPAMWVRFRTREYTRIMREELERIEKVRDHLREWASSGRIPHDQLTPLSVYNAFLNGDWKRQSFFRPSREKVAQIALYEWRHDPEGFRTQIGRSQQMIDLRGAFAESPIPTLIVEGEHDLTWSADKVPALHHNHPGAELVVLPRAAHEPFADAPELFFARLRHFVYSRRTSAEFLVRSVGDERDANHELVGYYKRAWLPQLSGSSYYFRYLQRVGFALYDVEQYAEALIVFQAVQEAAGQREGQEIPRYVALVWQGHVLDLQGERAAAVARYRAAACMHLAGSWSHPEFGMQFEFTAYAEHRMETPFTRIEWDQGR
jgi:proline iminopeptidase